MVAKGKAAPKRGEKRPSLAQSSFEASAAGKKIRVEGPPQTAEEKVTRCLLDNFREFTPEMIDEVVIDNLPLRQRLLRDKKQWMSDRKSITMGNKYYDNLRAKYGGSNYLPNLLKPDKKLAVNQKLRRAMEQAREKVPKIAPLRHCLQTTTTLNQRELCPIGEVQTLLALDSDSTWSAAEHELLIVVSSGQLGCQLFGFAVGDLVCNSVDAIMMLASEEVLGLSEFTEDAVRKMQTKHGDSLDNLPHVELMKQCRSVKIMYRGIALDIEVGCIFDELSLHIQSAVRTVAVDSERLAPLAGELDMVHLNEDNSDKDVDETLIAGSANAREWVSKLQSASGATGGALLEKERKALLEMDRFFVLELAFMECMVGSGGMARLQSVVMDTLPTRAEAKSLEDTLHAVDDIMNGELYNGASEENQLAVKVVRSLLQRMLDGFSPKQPENSSQWLQSVWARLAFFCRCPVADDASVVKSDTEEAELPSELVGRDALVHQWDQMKSKAVEDIVLADINTLLVFSFLADSAQLKEMSLRAADVANNAMKKGKISLKGAASSSTAAGQAKPAGRSRKKVADDLF